MDCKNCEELTTRLNSEADCIRCNWYDNLVSEMHPEHKSLKDYVEWLQSELSNRDQCNNAEWMALAHISGAKETKIDELRHALKCAEISLNGYRDYLHDMAIVEMDGKIYRGVPGNNFSGKWEMLYKHKTGNTWVLVQNYQIKTELNQKYAGSTGEDVTR